MAKYALDDEAIKPYFQMDSVRNGVFLAAKMLYGVNAEQLTDVPTYSPETYRPGNSLTMTAHS